MIVVSLGVYTLMCISIGALLGFIVGFVVAATGKLQ